VVSTSHKELKQETDLLAKHKKLLSMFQSLWDERTKFIKNLANKINVADDLLRINRAENRLINIIESSEITQKDNLIKIRDQAPKELKNEYEQLILFSNAWFSIIGVHKHFLEVEKDTVSLFITDRNARKKYFEALNSTLTVYSQIIKKYDAEKVIGQSIFRISKQKIAGLPSTTMASFNYGLYRIIAATALGAILFSDNLPGGSVGQFLIWALQVNFAGTIISFADMKLETASNIKSTIEEMFYFIKPTFQKSYEPLSLQNF